MIAAFDVHYLPDGSAFGAGLLFTDFGAAEATPVVTSYFTISAPKNVKLVDRR